MEGTGETAKSANNAEEKLPSAAAASTEEVNSEKSSSKSSLETKSSSNSNDSPISKLSLTGSRSQISGHSLTGVKSLTPWHQWLLKKEVQRREQTKNFKLLHKASTSPAKKLAVRTSKTSLEDQNRIVNEWVRKKDRDWREKRQAETAALQEILSKEQEVKELTAKMAKLKFKAWKDQKDGAKHKRNHKQEVPIADPEEQKKLCRESYAAWLQTVKDREKRQLEFRQLIVRGAYKAKPAADRNRKQGKPQKSGGVTTRSILCVLYCPKNTKM